MVQLPCRGSETDLVSFRLMHYIIYDNTETLRASFVSVYDLEKYIDGVRNSRGDSYPNTPRMSTFDYIKTIGWFWEVVDKSTEDDV